MITIIFLFYYYNQFFFSFFCYNYYILQRLSAFTKRSQKLQKERDKYSINPLALFTTYTNSDNTEFLTEFHKENNKIFLKEQLQEKLNKRKEEKELNFKETKDFTQLLNKLDNNIENNNNNNDKYINKKNQTSTISVLTPPPLTQSFVDRYESEIAPPKKIIEYKSVALKHKENLLKESKNLHKKYSQDLLDANKIENNVTKISNLLFEFVSILQSQREQVDDVNNAGKTTIDYVKDTDNELMLTIERSESHQKAMMMLTVGLALLLLLLDFITP